MNTTAFAAPPILSYQGRILKADGSPLQHSAVSFLFKITSPSGSCVIYREQFSGYDMTNSGGVFDVPIGSGTVIYPGDGSLNVLDSFNNGRAFTCEGGGHYSPVDTDGRLLRVQFHDGNGWKTVTPDNEIRSVPFAGYSLSAQKLGDNTIDSFVLKSEVNDSGSGSVSCDSGNFLTWDATTGKFGCAAVSGATGGTVTDVTASSPLAVTNGTSTPNITIQVANGSQNGYLSSGDWTTFNNKLGASSALSGDVSGTPSTTSVDKLKGTALSISSLSSNQVLKYSGGNWINSTLATSDISGLDATLSGISTTLSSAVMQSQFPASCAANQTLTFSSPSGSFSCSSIAINGSQVSGNISGNAAGFTGSLSGDVSGTQGATSVDKIKGIAVSATTPTSNQVLTYTGGSWTPADLPSGILSGTGTAGYVPYYNTSTTLANSGLYYDGSNVGIGTASPAAKLDVNGTVKATAFQGNGSALTGVLATPAGSANQIQFNNSGSMGASNKLIWDNANERLGIGTTAPQRRLEISTSNNGVYSPTQGWTSPLGSGASGYPGLRIQSTSAGDDYGAFMELLVKNGSSNGQNAYIGAVGTTGASNYSPTIVIGQQNSSSSYTERMRIDSTGNVGIGTTTPSEKLEVNGNIKGTQLCIGADCRSTWPSGSGGTVTSIVAGTGLTGGTITTTGTLAVDVGTTANKIVQLDASGKLPAVDGSALTSLNASNLASGTVAAGRMPALTGDVTTSAGSVATTLAKIQGKTLTVTSPASGDYLKYNGTAWVNGALSSASLSDASDLLKASNMPANCAANQTLTFSSPTGTWTCSTIANLDAGVITSGTIASARLPASATYWSAATGGINYAGGNVGIGTSSPSQTLDVNGDFRLGRSYSETGVLQSSSSIITVSGDDLILEPRKDTTGRVRIKDVNSDANISFYDVGSGQIQSYSTSGTAATLALNPAGGNVGIGTTTPTEKLVVSSNAAALPSIGVPGTVVHVAGVDGTTSRVLIDTFGTGSGGTANLSFRAAEGTAASPTSLLSGDVIGQVSWLGRGATTYSTATSAMRATASENWTDTANGSAIEFFTVANGTASSAERVRIDHNGNVGIGTTTPINLLHLVGGGGDEGAPGIFIQDPTATSAYGGSVYYDDRGGLNTVKLSAVDNNVDIGYVAIDRMTGNVGIGTDAPAEHLDLGGGNIKMGYQNFSCSGGSCTASGGVASLQCPAGTQIITGGCDCGSGTYYQLRGSYPSSGNKWNCVCGQSGAGQTTATVYATCANIK